MELEELHLTGLKIIILSIRKQYVVFNIEKSKPLGI
jgi:hypothetical protein